MRDILFRAYLKDRPMEYFGLHNGWPTNWTGWNTIMQSTGLKDKKGVLIYEGDIVKQFGCPILFEIGFDKCSFFALGINSTMRLRFHQPYGEIEIIGNIYENPELLTKNKNDNN